MSNHLDRLSAIDASFLLQEGPTSHAHVGGVVLVAGPAPSRHDLRRRVASRLDFMPRYRHRLAHGVFDRARPVWVDDPGFDLDHHVRHMLLAAPARRRQLERAVANLFGLPLDRSRPLWEIWMIEGLQDDALAMVFKVHHAMADGSAGIDLLTLLCDADSAEPGSMGGWSPQRTPGSAELTTRAVRGGLGAVARLAAAGHAARPSSSALAQAVPVGRGAAGLLRGLLRTPPPTPLTAPIGPDRRVSLVSCRLSDAKLVKAQLGGTVNDVVLAVVSGALRRFLLSRGIQTSGLQLTALVPVSLREPRDNGRPGNRIAVMRGTLPVHVADPVERLRVVRESMNALKASNQARATEALITAQNFLPPVLLPLITRINVSPRMFNVLVTNLPGPPFELSVLGRQLLEAYPIALLQPEHPLAIAIASYNGQLNFGLLGDYDAMPDLELVADGIRAELATLMGVADGPTDHVKDLMQIS